MNEWLTMEKMATTASGVTLEHKRAQRQPRAQSLAAKPPDEKVRLFTKLLPAGSLCYFAAGVLA